MTAHVSGLVWQDRFKAFPIEQDNHLLTVLRYIEQNPVHAHRVDRVEDWRWSSARVWSESLRGPRAEAGLMARPAPWLDWVNEPLEETGYNGSGRA